jgi:hypothetical protein
MYDHIAITLSLVVDTSLTNRIINGPKSPSRRQPVPEYPRYKAITQFSRCTWHVQTVTNEPPYKRPANSNRVGYSSIISQWHFVCAGGEGSKAVTIVRNLSRTSDNVTTYEGVSKSFRTGRLERELQMFQLCARRCSCMAILWVSLMSFAAMTRCVASQRVLFFCCKRVFRYGLSPETFGYTLV